MHDEKSLAVGGYVDRLAQDGNAAEAMRGKVAKAFVVVAGNVNDARPFARLAQHLLDDVVVFLPPVPGAAHSPDVDNVANQIKVLRLGRPEKVQQQDSIAATRSEMDVGNPNRAKRFE